MVGGSATSGKGLTALQVASALRVTAASHCTTSDPAAPASSTARGSALRRTRSGLNEGVGRLPPESYKRVAQHQVKVQEQGRTTTVEVTEYMPDVFYHIREVEAVDAALFADEWSLPEERLRMELGEGRSQALFLKSKNMAFMSKTIAEGEVDVLVDVLEAYTRHVSSHPNSLLMRFYLLLKVQVGENVGFILCFNDVFGNAKQLNEKWDIKGRVPKPGKYRSFPRLVRQAYEPGAYVIDTPREGSGRRGSEARHELENVVEVEAQPADSIATRKDKDLTRLFWVDGETRAALVAQLNMDYEWLRSVGLMDYSLLIGVAYQEGKRSREGKKYIIKNMRAPSEGEAAAVEVRPQGEIERPAGFKPLSDFAEGVHSLNDQEVYYIGVIDMLTKYTVNKRIANFCKGFLWEAKTLSTIPPPQYCQRISAFTNIIFPAVE